MKINLKNPVHFLAVGFGSGLIKPAPGTWGTLAGLILAILLWEISACKLCFLILSLITFIIGIKICQITSDDLGIHDDGRIVWDEMVAIWFMFSLLPEYNWFYYLLTFISFRFFDILKPYPIRYFDQYLENGLGIMVDDIFAAIYALCVLYITYWSI